MISTITIMSANSIAKSTGEASDIFKLDDLPADAKLFLDVLVTGDGTCKGTYEVGDDDDDTPYEPVVNTDIFTGHTKTTNTTGRDRYKWPDTPIIVGNRMRVRITETGGANLVVVTLKLVIWAGGQT